MYGRGLDRFKKAESSEPFSVVKSRLNSPSESLVPSLQSQVSQRQGFSKEQNSVASKPQQSDSQASSQNVTQVGGGQSNWQPPDWAIEPRPGVYYLDVVKDKEVLDKIALDKKRHIFGRQAPACDFVLDHQSVSRQHAAIVPHKNGSIFVIDLGSVHGTFVANERLSKEIPVELEVGQSLRFAASTRTYVLRKNNAALFPTPPMLEEIKLPGSPDPSDQEAVLAYNTLLNRYGVTKSELSKSAKRSGNSSNSSDDNWSSKRHKKARVSFRDQVGGILVEVVGISDGADVETEPGPIGVKEGSSLVGKYESLVQTTVIPKGKEQNYFKEEKLIPSGVTDKLQQVLNKVKSMPKGGIYDGLYGDSFSSTQGFSWASRSDGAADEAGQAKDFDGKSSDASNRNIDDNGVDDSDDLFG